MEVIPFFVAFWLMFRGFSAMGYSMDLQRYGTREWGWYMAFGILAVICSFAIIWQPGIGAMSIVYMLAFAFLIIGFFRVMLSFELRIYIKRIGKNKYPDILKDIKVVIFNVKTFKKISLMLEYNFFLC